MAIIIGNYFGMCVEADPNNFKSFYKNNLLVRVEIDVNMLLKRRMKLKKEGEEWFWVDFQYERLPPHFFFMYMVF